MPAAPSASPPPDPEADNRRNHYRVLHVQPEAPVEVIKASYRTLMTSLRGHPDLGGSHAHAAMINEAWGVLGDPVRRAAYDRLLRRAGHPVPRPKPGEAPMGRPGAPRPAAGAAAAAAASAPPSAAPGASSGASSSASASAAPGRDPSSATGAAPNAPTGAAPAAAPPSPRTPVADAMPLVRENHCALCGQLCLPEPRPDSRCLRCQAPLAALPQPGSPGHELLGRRGAARRGQDHVTLVHIGWPAPALPVRWRDLSLTGLSFFAPQPVAAGQRIHLVDQALEAVAEVVASRPQGRLYTVHARLLTALLLQHTGVFVSAQA